MGRSKRSGDSASAERGEKIKDKRNKKEGVQLAVFWVYSPPLEPVPRSFSVAGGVGESG